ncbi:MAG: archaemetzincin family Zn-dependent metalloprotease [Candidatus Aenigmarchaeota archaeon]|nr:archaemetzincin family Zn-dependent metalloprotease [Candidatus Aenigmarchaeota archaeon]MBU5689269.1 archaemetzincin family Zn-dependent metalloprotease [Candidatus Aenigmarchaeota archaeon]
MVIIQLTICYFGKIEPSLIDHVKKGLRAKLKIPVLLGTEIRPPEDSFNKFRQQYEANTILNHLEKNFDDKVLALTDKDIYTSGLNYVFGLAKTKSKAAIVSTFRLNTDNKELLKERLLKECMHEFGHVLGLQHCKEKGCVMNPSNSTRDIDNKNLDFCHMCQIALKI